MDRLTFASREDLVNYLRSAITVELEREYIPYRNGEQVIRAFAVFDGIEVGEETMIVGG